MGQTNPIKPFILDFEDARKETESAINEIMLRYNLSCYLYEKIIAEMHDKLVFGAKNELSKARAQYESAQRENEPEAKQ